MAPKSALPFDAASRAGLSAVRENGALSAIYSTAAHRRGRCLPSRDGVSPQCSDPPVESVGRAALLNLARLPGLRYTRRIRAL